MPVAAVVTVVAATVGPETAPDYSVCPMRSPSGTDSGTFLRSRPSR